MEEYQDTLMRALCATLESLSQYVVETDPSSVEQFRVHLGRKIRELQTQMESPDPKVVNEVPTFVRGELRDYRDAAQRYIDHLRSDLGETAQALNQMAQALQGQESGAHYRLRCAITDLRALRPLENLEEIRAGLRQSEAVLTECVEQLRREKESVIAQLRDEIRALQKSVYEAERAAAVDILTGAYKREEFQKLVRRDMVAGRRIAIIHLWMRNLHDISSSYSSSVVDNLLLAFCKRVQNAVPPETPVGRWRDDVFCVLLPAELTESVSAELLKRCGGRYICMEDGNAHPLYPDAAVTCVNVQSRDSDDVIFSRLDKIQLALSR